MANFEIVHSISHSTEQFPHTTLASYRTWKSIEAENNDNNTIIFIYSENPIIRKNPHASTINNLSETLFKLLTYILSPSPDSCVYCLT